MFRLNGKLLLVVLAAAVALGWLSTMLGVPSVDSQSLLQLIVALEGIGCIAVPLGRYLKSRNPFDPLIPICIGWFLFFVLRPWHVIVYNDYALLDTFLVPRSQVGVAIVVSATAFALFLFGYLVAGWQRGAPAPRMPQQGITATDWKKVFRTTLLILPIATLPWLYFISRNGFDFGHGSDLVYTGSAYVYSSVDLLGPACILFFLVWRFGTKTQGRWAGWLFLITMAMTAIIYAFEGSRARFIILLGSLALLWLWSEQRKQRRPKWSVVVLISTSLVLCILMIGAVRTSMSFKSGVSNIDLPPLSEAWGRFVGSNGDLNIFDTFCLALLHSDKLPRFYGQEFLWVFLHPIPRSLWPGKPDSIAHVYMRIILPDLYYKNIGFSASILIDFFMNFGMVGVYLMSAVAGFSYRRIYEWVVRSIHLPSAVAYFVPIWAVSPLMLRGEFVLCSAWALTYSVPMWFILRWSVIRDDRPPVSGVVDPSVSLPCQTPFTPPIPRR